MNKKILFNLLLVFFASRIISQPTITLSQFCTGFTWPTKIANCGDERIFVIQKTGKIFIVDSNGVKKTTPFIDLGSVATVPTSISSERGTLGMAFHPNYFQNGYFYVNYTRASDGATRVSRFQVSASNPDSASVSTELNLLTITQPFSNHNGGDIHFGTDGYLYIGMGDGGSANDPNNYATNRNSLLGKMLRIDVDNTQGSLNYAIPSDNPYADSSATNYKKEIWSYGLRNPWRWSFDRLNGDLWIGDVGQNAIEEVNHESVNSNGGKFYGWRCWEGNSSTGLSGCTGILNSNPPIFQYPHTLYSSCSITGGFVYRGAMFNSMYGYYFLTDYCSGRFWWVKQNASGTFSNGLASSTAGFGTNNFVTFGENKYGELFVGGISDGKIYKIKSNDCTPVASIDITDTAICSGSIISTPFAIGLQYQWNINGIQNIADTLNSLQVNSPGQYFVTVTKNGCSTSGISATKTFFVNPLPSLSFVGSLPSIVDVAAQSFVIQTSSSNAIITIDNVVTSNFNPSLLGIGIHQVNATLIDSLGCEKTITQNIQVSNLNGLINENYIAKTQVFPNPANDKVQIQLYHNYSKNLIIDVMDLSGRVIKSYQIPLINGLNQIELDVVNLQNGAYTIRLNDGFNVSYKKIIIRK